MYPSTVWKSSLICLRSQVCVQNLTSYRASNELSQVQFISTGVRLKLFASTSHYYDKKKKKGFFTERTEKNKALTVGKDILCADYKNFNFQGLCLKNVIKIPHYFVITKRIQMPSMEL